MSSYIVYPNFEWECERSQIITLEKYIIATKDEILIEKINYPIEEIFNQFVKEFNNMWLTFIKKFKKVINNIIKAVEHSMKIIKNKDLKLNINTAFIKLSFSNKLKKHKSQKISSLYKFYDELLDAIHFEILFLKKAYLQEIDNLKLLKNDLYDQLIVNESTIKKFTFPADTFMNVEANCLGEDLINQLFIENCKIFNKININDLLMAETYQIDLINAFSKKVIHNLKDICNPNSEYYERHMELVNDGYVSNNAINEFIELYEIDNTLVDQYIDLYKIRYMDNIDKIKKSLLLIKKKSEVILECIVNITKYNLLSTHLSEEEIKSDIMNIKPEELNKIKEIVKGNYSQIFKHNGRFLDFSNFKLGSVCILDSREYDELIERYLDFDYSSILLYYIGTYDFTIISHGYLEHYSDLAEFIRVYKQNRPIEYSLFKQCYSEEIQIYTSIINKNFDDINEDDSEYIEKVIDSDDFINNNSNHIIELIRNFRYSYLRRWVCDSVYIPQINNSIEDVEMIIYIMNINKIRKLCVNICNKYNYRVNPKVISFFDHMTAWISPRDLLK